MTPDILALLIAERDKLNRAIEALQGPTKRRGRPPKSLTAASVPGATTSPAEAPKKRKTRHFSEEQRQAAAERMKLMWANKKAGKKPKKA